MSIGNLFVRLREHRGYSQTLAAKVLGIPVHCALMRMGVLPHR